MPTSNFGISAGTDDQIVGQSHSLYPPDANFVRLTTGTTGDIQRTNLSGPFYVYCGLLAFDTSSLPNDITVLSASLTFRVSSKLDEDSRNFTGEWYEWDGTSATDHADYASSSAFSTSISGLSTVADTTVALTNPNQNISRTGYTKLRLHVDGAAPSGRNRVSPVMSEHATLTEPTLEVSYTRAPAVRAYSSVVNGLDDTVLIPHPTVPEVPQVGDVMFAAIGAKGGTGVTITPPSEAGWTLLPSGRVDDSTNLAGALYSKPVAASEPAFHEFTLDSVRKASAAIICYQGAQALNPVDVVGGQSNAASTSVAAPSVTTHSASETLVYIGIVDGSASFTPPSGMTERVDQAG